MLRELHIDSFAIIDTVEIHFSPGLNIITGETGAGKSIILGALSLLVGERASSSMIRTGRKRARIQALCDIAHSNRIRSFLKENELAGENEKELIIRRDVSVSGRSSCFINGNAVNLDMLKTLGDFLVDLHGQHQHQSLFSTDNQLELLDAYGKNGPLLSEYTQCYQRYSSLMKKLGKTMSDEQERIRKKDFLEYQIKEIESSELIEGEDEALEIELTRLKNAQKIMELAGAAYDVMYEGSSSETTLVGILSAIERDIRELEKIDPSIAALNGEIENLNEEMGRIAGMLRDYIASIDADSQRLTEVEDRVHLIKNLKRKYGASVKEILAALKDYTQQRDSLEHRDAEIEHLQEEVNAVRKELAKKAEELSRRRKRASEDFEHALLGELELLNMQKARFEVKFIERDKHVSISENEAVMEPNRFGPAGTDEVEYFLTPNPGEDLRPLRKIASGGEISRIMLALKSISAVRDGVATLLFDEIDLGIGGATADVVGKKMAHLAASHQIICITHLPQIASKADRHFKVEKRVTKGRTITSVQVMDKKSGIEEIARLIDGDNITELSLRHAKEMIRGGCSVGSSRK